VTVYSASNSENRAASAQPDFKRSPRAGKSGDKTAPWASTDRVPASVARALGGDVAGRLFAGYGMAGLGLSC
jgi:hypothetical protein